MIAGIFHNGSGLGNQLARYVFTRVKALDMGVDFGMLNPNQFKGKDFMSPLMGKYADGLVYGFTEERVDNENGVDIRPYDPKTERIVDNTLVDGEFQDERYFIHRLPEIRKWLATDPLEVEENECVLAFRGGEFTLFPDLYLKREYWDNAMANMRKIRPDMKFRVVTDDLITALDFFPELPVSHEISHDWRSIRNAPYLILSNSSFGILPAHLGDAKKIISPLHWARHNLGFWALPQNKYSRFTYIDRQGNEVDN